MLRPSSARVLDGPPFFLSPVPPAHVWPVRANVRDAERGGVLPFVPFHGDSAARLADQKQLFAARLHMFLAVLRLCEGFVSAYDRFPSSGKKKQATRDCVGRR